MNEPTPVLKALRDELLKQNGGAAAAVGDEVDRLRRIVESQQRRARRLTYWTIGVWALWFALVLGYFAVPILARSSAPPRTQAPTSNPTAQADTGTAHAPQPSGPRPSANPLGLLIGTLLVGYTFVGPFVGVVLLVMMVLARRTAGMNEIRASLASIDAQLRLLALTRTHPPEPPATPK